ncbi:hypothetical protein FHX79_112023 [Streptomyces cavourensis]|nr:hypothetical protein FHX79_112023 [Streptomyces cavourensis]
MTVTSIGGSALMTVTSDGGNVLMTARRTEEAART